MDDTLLLLFCAVDEFCQEFIPEWEKHLLQQGLKKRRTPSRLTPSEIMTRRILAPSATIILAISSSKCEFLLRNEVKNQL